MVVVVRIMIIVAAVAVVVAVLGIQNSFRNSKMRVPYLRYQ